ncbi:MAG: hypothetical protein A2Z14_10595 [Chloroflexi bacterium RBG_16_48_8]|nr:MAG: hypothetical protein A2Z14_10595 [Chloroflexi bacterium RBG_16_48_8]
MENRLPLRVILHGIRKMITISFLGLSSSIISACNSSELIKVGDPAPAFTLSSAGGTEVSLSDFEGRQPVLLYFHMAKG